jgi:ketosteroid isomerase-like protein
MNNATLVRAYIAAVERFDAAATAPLLHEEIVQTEHPNVLAPAGRRRRKAEMLADLDKGAAFLRRQSYAISSLVSEDDRVAVEARWEGEMAVPLKTLSAGDLMVAHIAMSFRIKDEQIIEQTNYDCFQAF